MAHVPARSASWKKAVHLAQANTSAWFETHLPPPFTMVYTTQANQVGWVGGRAFLCCTPISFWTETRD